MRIEDQINSDYFEWMYDLVCEGRFAKTITYRKLLTFLHDTEFVYFVPYDENRAAEGIGLRYRFCLLHDCEDMECYLRGPCSVLEMIIALAIRCEENLMVNPDMGDRTGQWFWGMITNMGLGSMNDVNFNEWLVNDVVTRFLNREYEPDGQGGLFTVKGWNRDMRTAEIWHQLMAFINTMI
jgi:hypothetical protein